MSKYGPHAKFPRDSDTPIPNYLNSIASPFQFFIGAMHMYIANKILHRSATYYIDIVFIQNQLFYNKLITITVVLDEDYVSTTNPQNKVFYLRKLEPTTQCSACALYFIATSD